MQYPDKTPNIFLLVCLASLNPVAFNIAVPLIPFISISFNSEIDTAHLSLTVFLVATAVFQLIIGSLSDRFGRRPLTLVGIVVLILATLLCVLAPTIELFLLGRLLQGAGSAISLALVRTIVYDTNSKSKSVSIVGYVTMGMTIVPMLGPILAGYLEPILGWRSAFQAILGFFLFLFFFCLIFLPETRAQQSRINIDNSFRRIVLILLSHRSFRNYTFISAFSLGVFYSFVTAGAGVAYDVMGMTPTTFGLYYSLLAIGYIIGNFVSGRYAARLDPDILIQIGNLLSLTSVAALTLGLLSGHPHPVVLFAPMLLSSLANGLVLPSAMISAANVEPAIRGMASGLSATFQLVSCGAVTLVVGQLLSLAVFSNSFWPLVIGMTSCSVAALLVGVVHVTRPVKDRL